MIDIASGSGLVAIAAAMAGAAAVTAYDIDPLATAAIEANAAANGVTVRAVCADVLDRDDLPPPGTGLVLVADAFYQRDLATRVMRFASRGQARGATVLAADFGRAYLPRDRLTPLAAYDVPGQRVTEDTDIKHTTIWTLAERPAKSRSTRLRRPGYADQVALRVGEVPDHQARRCPLGTHHALAAQALGPLQGGLDIGHADVEHRVGRVSPRRRRRRRGSRFRRWWCCGSRSRSRPAPTPPPRPGSSCRTPTRTVRRSSSGASPAPSR